MPNLEVERELSTFRKIAPGTWKTTGDPSVYGSPTLRLACFLAIVAACEAHEPPRVAPKPPPAAAPDPWAAPARPPPVEDRATIAKLVVTDGGNRPAPLGDRLRDVTVVAFWASWCHPCLDELPMLEQLARAEHANARVAVVGVNLDDAADHAAALAAIRKLHLTFPIVYDPEAHVSFQINK